jgi:penicillin-binding protein-related factor A (putative recombinase)
VYKCWRKWRSKFEKSRRKDFDGILTYFPVEYLEGKEKKNFQHKQLQPMEVAYLIKEDIQHNAIAFASFQHV